MLTALLMAPGFSFAAESGDCNAVQVSEADGKTCEPIADDVLPRGLAVTSKNISDLLQVAWESIWLQNGYPAYSYKWQEDIRVYFYGYSVDYYRPRALHHLQHVADVAGIRVVEVDASEKANVQVEFRNGVGRQYFDQHACATSGGKLQQQYIVGAKIELYANLVDYCMQHEAMHLLGINGHPYFKTVLSYYYNGQELTELDEYLLRVRYSSKLATGAYPFAAMRVHADYLLAAVPAGEEKLAAEKAVNVFFADIIKQMESFALANGSAPKVLYRSSKTTANGLWWGRTQMAYYLGTAYLDGDLVDIDQAKGLDFIHKAANRGASEAQYYLGTFYSSDENGNRDLAEAFKWYTLASESGLISAKKTVEVLAMTLTPDVLADGKNRRAKWVRSTSN